MCDPIAASCKNTGDTVGMSRILQIVENNCEQNAVLNNSNTQRSRPNNVEFGGGRMGNWQRIRHVRDGHLAAADRLQALLDTSFIL